MDKWPEIVADGAANPDKQKTVTYTLTETCLGNPIQLQVTTEQYCVYCDRFSEPEFRDPAFSDLTEGGTVALGTVLSVSTTRVSFGDQTRGSSAGFRKAT